jgi:hypothetical protein
MKILSELDAMFNIAYNNHNSIDIDRILRLTTFIKSVESVRNHLETLAFDAKSFNESIAYRTASTELTEALNTLNPKE